MTNVNVTILVPGNTVKSMADELADGSVANAVEAAKAAYTGVDSDGNVPVVEYTEDFDNAVTEAVALADKTDGPDLIVIVTDFECNDRAAAVNGLKNSDDMFVLVPVSNQGYDEAWAAELDDDAAGDNNVDVVSPSDLSNPDVARAEVNTWLRKVGANA
jgi:alkaline phosphatase